MELTLFDIFDMFEVKRDCLTLDVIRKLQEWKLLPQERKCSKGHLMTMSTYTNCRDGFQWRCRQTYISSSRKRMRCEEKSSIRKNTFFNVSHLSLYQIFVFGYLWFENVPLEFAEKEAMMSKENAYYWSRFNREIIIYKMITNHGKIGGVGQTVEIGESNFGKRKNRSGLVVKEQWVFGGVERDSERCFLVPVEARTKEILLETIQQWIFPGTTIISKFWKAYNCLSDEGYLDLKDNHSIHFIDFVHLDPDAHTKTVHRMWRQAKRGEMPRSEEYWKKHFFEGHLATLMFLRQCRSSNLDPLREFFQAAGELYSPVRDAIKANPDPDNESEYESESETESDN